MARSKIDREWCKGCSLCVEVCPSKLIKIASTLNEKGYFPAESCDPDSKCKGCGLCVIVCPDIAIDIVEEE